MRTNLILFLTGMIVVIIYLLFFIPTSDNSDIPTTVVRPMSIMKNNFLFLPINKNNNRILITQKSCDMSLMEQVPPPVVSADIIEPERTIPNKVSRTNAINPSNNNTISKDCIQYLDIIDNYDWPVEEALSICREESHGDISAVGDKDNPPVSCGLFQIRTHRGRPTCNELKNPETNIQWAYSLWKKHGWNQWFNVAKRLGLL